MILIHDLERDSVRAALQLSAQKWKSLHVSGSETYLRQCVELAAEQGFRISNPELAPAIEAERQRRLRERQLHRDRHPDSIPQPRPIRDVAEAYDRHLAELNRSDLGPRDMSRVDAEVAVRLHLTGHSRVEIEQAVRERAPAHRPSEQRDWDAYARRAADRAFGPSGAPELKRLERVREDLFRLEGRGGRELELGLDLPFRRGLGLGR